MKHNLFILIIGIFFYYVPLTSQIEDRQSFELSFSPLTAISVKPNYRIGVNYLYKRWLFGFDVGYGNYHLNKFWVKRLHWHKEYRHWVARPHVFYTYNVDHDGMKRVHSVGIEVFYKNTKDHFEDHYYEELETGHRFLYDNAWYQDVQTGVHLANLSRLEIAEKLSIESIVGFGLAYRNIQYSSIQNPRPLENNDRGFLFLFNSKYTQGGRWVGRFRLGFDITYRLY